MSKLVVLNLGKGTLQDGFPHVSVQLQDENDSNWKQFQGSLPAAPNIIDLYRRWQLLYDLIYEARSINIGLRNSQLDDKDIIIDNADVTHVSDAEFYQVCEELQNKIDNWLDAEDFRNIDRQLRMRLAYNDEIRVIISTENIYLRRLPWHVWRFFRDYTQAEVALSPIEFEAGLQKNSLTQTIRILAILGDSTGIDINEDRKLLSIPGVETIFLVEPRRQQLNELLWDEQGWDILFFAGHSSSTNGETGNIYINSTESLTITQLRNALKKAISGGLQLAIFNSCDGLGLARQLDDLHIPQIIVMREPVPDKVAQEFLKRFLMGFANGKSFYLAVREAREQLQGLEGEFPGASWLPVICQNPAVTPLTWWQMGRYEEANVLVTEQNERTDKPIKSKLTRRRTIRALGRTAILISIAVAVVVCSFRHSGILQPLELQVFDQMMRMRSLNEKPDDRLLIITVTEEDLKYQDQQGMQRQGSLSDAALAQIIAKLEPLKPSVIGLDIYHDFPIQHEQVALTKKLRENENFFAICKHSDLQLKHTGTAPPPEVPKERLGFSDVATDNDGILRRYLFYMSPNLDSPCPTETALGMQLALRYLEKKGQKIAPEINDDSRVQVGRITLPIVTSHWGGYQRLDAAGYQIMLNYRRSRNIAKNVTLTQILQGNFDPNFIKNRIIIIGTIVQNYEDNLYTPLSLDRLPDQSMRGVYIQAEMASQILSAYLDGRPLISVWPASLETFWIWIWSLIGSSIALYFKKPLVLVLITAFAVCIIFTFCFGIFEVQSIWIPFIPSGLSIVSTVIILAILRTRKQN